MGSRAALAFGLALATACVVATHAQDSPPVVDSERRAEPEAPLPPEPWEIPPEALKTQSLFRVEYEGPEGQGGFRLTLRLESASRYRVTTVDAVGRPVWSLSVEGESGLWLDHRQQRFCRFEGQLGLDAVPLSPFALPALPALLLGRLPEPPASVPYLSNSLIEFTDRAGRRWTAKRNQNVVEQWTLWEAGEPAVWWGKSGDQAILSERAQGIQLRWRRVLMEPLAELPPPPAVGEGYVSGCREATNPARLP